MYTTNRDAPLKSLFPRQRGNAPTGPAVPSGGRNLTTGAIVGIVLGCVIGALALAVIIWGYCYRKKRNRQGPRKPKQRKERSEDPLYAGNR